MLIQVYDDTIINIDQVNYVKEFTDLGDGKEKTLVAFTNKDSICLPITLKEFAKNANTWALRHRVRDVELKDVEPKQDVTKK